MFIQHYPKEQTKKWKIYEDYNQAFNLFYQQARQLITNLNQFWNISQNTILNHNFKIEQNQMCFGKTQTELLEQEFNQKKEKTNGR